MAKTTKGRAKGAAPTKAKGTPPAEWRSRIVGTGEADPKSLLPNPRNWRRHPILQQKGMRAVLDKVGWVQSVLVNKRTGHLVDGHLRALLAVERGERVIPVTFLDLSTEEEALVLATLDPLAGMAEGSAEALDQLLAGVKVKAGSALDDLLKDVSRELPAGKFVEFTAAVAGQVQMTECPKCHHKFPA